MSTAVTVPAGGKLAAWARILPFLAYMACIVLGDVLEHAGWAGAQLRWLYPLKVVLVVICLTFFWRLYSELRGPRLGLAAILEALAVGALVWVLWINLSAPWMVVGTAAGFDPRTGGQIDWPVAMLRLAGATLMVPLMEELFWRSFLLRWIAAAGFLNVKPARAGFKGFIVTVVLFGFEHNLWLAGIIAGAAYTLLYMRSNSLWSPILAHAVTNGLLGVWIISTGNWTYW